MEDNIEDQYRFCVYCRADCYLTPDQQIHAPACPTRTGLYPIDDYILYHCAKCPNCGEEFDGFYTFMDPNTGKEAKDTDTGIMLCLQCSITQYILEDK